MAPAPNFAAMLRDVGTGVSTFFRALPWAVRHGLWWAFVVPIVLWLALSLGAYAALEAPLEELAHKLSAFLRVPEGGTVGSAATSVWKSALDLLSGAGALFVGLLLRLAIAYVLFMVNRYVVLVVLSPLLAFLSERTEAALTGRTYPFTVRQFLRDAWRGARVALRNVLLEIAITCGIWAGSLIVPLLAPLGFILLFLVSAYFSGYSMFDYVFERRRFGVRESVRGINQRVGLVIGNGACFVLLMRIPLLGLCFAPAMGAIGAAMALAPNDRPGLATASTFGAGGP